MCGNFAQSSPYTAIRPWMSGVPFPGGQFFQIHGSKLKLHPVRYLGQASVLRITHSVFFFGVCKDAFNRLFTPPVKALV